MLPRVTCQNGPSTEALHHRLNQLATKHAELQFFFELTWVDQPTTQRAFQIVKRRCDDATKAVRKLIDAIDFPESSRKTLVEQVNAVQTAAKDIDLLEERPEGHCDAEIAPEDSWSLQRACYRSRPDLIKKSRRLVYRLQEAVASLGSDEAELFKLLGRLEVYNYPTFFNKARGKYSHGDSEAVRKYVLRCLPLVDKVCQRYEMLGQIKPPKVTSSAPVMVRLLAQLREDIGKWCDDPNSVPGYLGIIINPKRPAIRRFGHQQEIELAPKRNSPHWKIFHALYRAAGEPVDQAEIKSCWAKPFDSSTNLYQGIAALKRKLKPLGLRIKNNRSTGYWLVG